MKSHKPKHLGSFNVIMCNRAVWRLVMHAAIKSLISLY